jgi:transposase
MIDTSAVRVRQHGACFARNREQRMGRSRGGRTSKVHAVVDRARNLVERFFNKIKQCRRIATRHDKVAANYLARIKLASIRLWLRAYESAPSPL